MFFKVRTEKKGRITTLVLRTVPLRRLPRVQLGRGARRKIIRRTTIPAVLKIQITISQAILGTVIMVMAVTRRAVGSTFSLP
jgi:hypothetical protein